MLLSLAYILLFGMFAGFLCKKIHLPALLGMILMGIILNLFNLIDTSVINISTEIRRIALIIILMRAGLSLSTADFKKIGRPAIFMSFVPATFEIIGMTIFAPLFLKVSFIESLIIGSVTAAVSPAVIVPKMIKLMEENYGTSKSIPQLILAGASIDDVFVIVLFTVFTGLAQGEKISLLNIMSIPVSIITGIFIGVIIGFCIFIYFKKFHLRDTIKVIILMSISFILVTIEDNLKELLPFSSLITIMTIGIMIKIKNNETAERISKKFNKLWCCAEILLFVLVGIAVDIKYAFSAGILVILMIFCVLFFRMAGVFLCLLGTNLNYKERLFCMIAYIPKATVQAAIGSIPLSMGLACGNMVLSVAVTAILITAPLGAFLIDITYKKLL